MTDEHEDEDLWQRAVAGDGPACEQVAELASTYARETLRRRGAPSADLEDLVQEAAIGVERCRQRGHEVRFFRKFVYFRALAVLKDFRTRQLRQARLAQEQQSVASNETRPPLDDELADKELLDAVAACRDALPDPLRQVVILRHSEDCMIREIADQMSLSLGGVRERFRRAWAQIHDCLKRKGFGTEEDRA